MFIKTLEYGRERRWSECAHKKPVGRYVAVADSKVPSRKCILGRYTLGRDGHWGFPERSGKETQGCLLALLEELHGNGAISDGDYAALKEGITDVEKGPETCAEIIRLGRRHGYWIGVFGIGISGYLEMAEQEPDSFDPQFHGLVWGPPAAWGCGMAADCRLILKALVDEITAYESGCRDAYSVFAAPAERVERYIWSATSEFRMIEEGLSRDQVGHFMQGLDEESIAERLGEPAGVYDRSLPPFLEGFGAERADKPERRLFRCTG